MKNAYEPPLLQGIGTLQQLTRQSKRIGGADGLDLEGVPIGNVSVV